MISILDIQSRHNRMSVTCQVHGSCMSGYVRCMSGACQDMAGAFQILLCKSHIYYYEFTLHP